MLPFASVNAGSSASSDEVLRENRVEAMAEKQQEMLHTMDSLNILLYSGLLVLTMLTVYVFRRRQIRFFHESGMIMIYGKLALAFFFEIFGLFS